MSPSDSPTRLESSMTPDDATRVLPPRPPASAAGGSSRAAESAAPPSSPESAAALAPGTRIGEFEITRLVGQGGFGIVYEATDHALERAVALKEYLPASLAARVADGSIAPLSERQRETFDLGMRSFINEARLLAQFDHPSLVKVYRFWEERGTSYMVMPYYRGRTLRDALAASAAGTADEKWLLTIVDGVTQALAVMHSAQCYHRDIAPDNIMLLEEDDRPIVLDFGAARRVISDRTQAITVILKPGYAPVEQYAEMPDMKQGAWTDVYALAAVLHLAVTGRVPPPSVGRLLSDSYLPLAQDPKLAGRYSGTLLRAIDAGLAVRPDARPQTMDEFRALLGLDAGGVATRVAVAKKMPTVLSGTGAAPIRAPTRSRAAWAGAAALAFLLAAGAAWWWSQAEVDRPGTSARDAVVADTAAPLAPGPAADVTAVAPPLPTRVEMVETVPPAPERNVATPPAEQVAAANGADRPPSPAAAGRTPMESLQALALQASPQFRVTGGTVASPVTIGRDRLGFEVSASRGGFVYVYLLDSDGELYLLFPNALDKRNRIEAGQKLALPRAAWAMESGGPAGVNHFAALVSDRERDFTESGMLAGGMFAQFPRTVLEALERARGDGPTPLLGHPVCPAGESGCSDSYGVAYFEIVEQDAGVAAAAQPVPEDTASAAAGPVGTAEPAGPAEDGSSRPTSADVAGESPEPAGSAVANGRSQPDAGAREAAAVRKPGPATGAAPVARRRAASRPTLSSIAGGGNSSPSGNPLSSGGDLSGSRPNADFGRNVPQFGGARGQIPGGAGFDAAESTIRSGMNLPGSAGIRSAPRLQEYGRD